MLLLDVTGSWRLVNEKALYKAVSKACLVSRAGTAGAQRDLALFDFFALVSPTDPLGFLESGFLGTSFSIKNSLPHFGQVRRANRILSITVPITRAA
jgi:hypothetical protein